MIDKNYKSIPPIKPRDVKSSAEKAMKDIFFKLFYDYILTDIEYILKDIDIMNAKENIIITYLKKGEIYYEEGVFKGSFNAKISSELTKLGAYYDIRKAGYVLNDIRLPVEVARFLFNKTKQQTKAINEMLEVLENKESSINLSIKDNALLTQQYSSVYAKIDKHFKTYVPTDLSLDQTDNFFLKRKLTDNFINDLQLSIKGWTEKEIQKMRTELVDKNIQGYRAESLKSFFKRHKSLTDTQAERLAQSETRLALSNYNKALAVENDIYKYKWGHPNPNFKTSRKGHVHLHNLSKSGTIFDFREKPINIDTGKPTEPGLEYNCGCFAILQV